MENIPCTQKERNVQNQSSKDYIIYEKDQTEEKEKVILPYY